jgi:predicted O-linked N-acetylglucosamine transferase (SPINDLY family)
VPGSRLVLKWKSFAYSSVRRSFRARFARHGVAPERIECRCASSHFLALAEYNEIDIALDPFPFNGGLTSCEAMWMGVPVLTMAGATPIGRQSASFLTALELPELITRTPEEFVSRAAELAGDLARLAELREGLRERMANSPVCDGRGFTRHLEEAYRGMLPHGTADDVANLVCRAMAEEALPAAVLTSPAPLEPAPRRLRVVYLVPEKVPCQALPVLEAAALHESDELEILLYLEGSAEQLPQAGWGGRRHRCVGAFDDHLLARLLMRERIDLLVDLGESAGRGELVTASVPVRIALGELAAASVAESPLKNVLRLEALYGERWLSWFVAQRKPRAASRPETAALVAEARGLRMAARLEEAEPMLLLALQNDPRSADALTELGVTLVYQWRLAEGLACFRRALVFDPGHVKARSSLLFALNYSDRLTSGEIYRQSRKYERAQRRHIPAPATTFANPPDPERPLRVGYLSGDFYRHSVSFFFEPLLKNHDGAKFQTVCYSSVQQPDETTARLKESTSLWRECSELGDGELAERVRGDGIDILVDLAGHTGAKVRLPALLQKPAPLQVSWLGYPNSTGISSIDYRLTDADADPAGEGDRWYSERLVRLPDGFLCYQPPVDAPEPAPAPLLHNGFVTFGSFNILPKLSASTVALWAELLREVPDARLLLKCHPLGDQRTRERVLRLFARFGVDPRRLTLLPVVPAQEHLALYREIDLALDPFPYNGTTTTCEALWMGVPVLTLTGDSHAGRVGTSLLKRVGLPELVARDTGEYLAIARSLAADRDRLSRYRGELRQMMAASPLCDGELFARNVEAAYRAIWRSWCRKNAAQLKKEGRS